MNATTIYENGATGELSGIHLGFKGRDSGIIRATRNASITIDPDTKLPCGSIQDYLQESGGRINNKARSY